MTIVTRKNLKYDLNNKLYISKVKNFKVPISHNEILLHFQNKFLWHLLPLPWTDKIRHGYIKVLKSFKYNNSE